MDSRAQQNRQQRQKLRSSCDTCHSAKVKCTSSGPLQVCERCASHGIQCSYSPSLRLSKQNAAKQSSSSSTPSRSRRQSSVQQVGGLSDHINAGRNRPNGRVQYSDLTPPGLIEDFSMDGMTTPSTSSSGFGISNQSQDFVTPIWTDQDPPNQAMMAQMGPIDTSMFWNGDAVDRLFTKSGLHSSSHKPPHLAPDAQEATINAASSANSSNSSSDDTISAKAATQSINSTIQSRNACRCHADVLQALQLSQHLGAGVRKSGDLHIAFDVLLADNKIAIGRCTQMLDCRPCFSGSTSFLLVAALLSQTLTLYNLACEVYLAQSPPEKERQGGASIVPGPLRINFGAYRLEEEDEVLLKKELMLIELRKVETLLTRLKDVAGDSENQSEAATYDAVMSSLTNNLRQVVKTIRPGR